MFAVIAALESEATPLRRRLHAQPTAAPPALRRCWRAATAEQQLILAVTGLGPQRAAAGAIAAVERWRPDVVLAVGYGGALLPQLRLGDVVIGRTVATGAGDPLPATPWLLERARRAAASTGLSHHEGTVLTVDRIVGTPAEKARLAASGAAVVDMESHAVARVAAEAGLPFLALRAISDEADQLLPDLASFVNASGQPRPGRLVAYLLREPSHLGRLIRLALGTRRAGTNLAGVVAALVEAGGVP